VKRQRPVRRNQGGILITGEGVEGSGKTTQLHRLAAFLQSQGYEVVETREPGGTPTAEHIRQVLLNTQGGTAPSPSDLILPWCEVFLILAARTQHVTQVIRPALQRGAVVICDRFADSTLAYQGYGRGLPVAFLRKLNGVATGGLSPDLTLLFDLPVEVGLARRRQGRLEETRIDRESRAFHGRVRRGFLTLANRGGRRIRVINARKPPDAVAKQVERIVGGVLRKRRYGLSVVNSRLSVSGTDY
jgi:dTMP kinase